MTNKPAHTPLIPISLRRLAVGPVVTLAIVIGLRLLVPVSPLFPNPLAMLTLAVVFAAAYAGLRSGLASAALAWLYFLIGYLTSSLLPGAPDRGLAVMLSAGVTLPLVAVLTGLLHRRLEQRALETARRERQQAALLEETQAGRSQAVNALHEADARFQTLMQNLPVIAYTIGENGLGEAARISPQMQAMLGVTPGEPASTPALWKSLLHPDDRDRVLADIRRATQTGEALDNECRLVTEAGQVVWLRHRLEAQSAPDAGQRLAHGIMLDISDYKAAEQARRESEDLYQLVTWATSDAIWVRDLKADTIWWNDGMKKLFQYPAAAEPQPYAQWAEYIHPDERERVQSSVDRALSGGDHFWAKEYRLRKADGTYADVFDRGYILRDAAGQPTRAVGAMADVSERRRVERALREAEGNYRALVEQLPAVVYIATGGEYGAWRYVSPQIKELLGFTPQEWMADPSLWLHQLHPDDRQRTLDDEVRDAHRDPRTVSAIEYRMLTRDGQVIWVRDSATVLPGPPGQPPVYHGVLTDITEQKHAADALQEANQILTQWLQHSERRTMELGLLNELSSLLQNCHDINEACRSASPILRRLFGEEYLGLYTVSDGAEPPVVQPLWADRAVSALPFLPDDCWALRRNQMYIVDADHPGPLCGHLPEPPPSAYVCAPITVQGHPRALLHIRKAPPAGAGPADERNLISDSQQQLARTVSDSMGLAFANLELRNSLREQSIRDLLTGLYNRRYMEESLEREIFRAARHRRAVGIIMLDIDHFKVFNDAYGHPAGDVLLRDLGRILRQHIRGADIACRYGGEEFILILPEASLEDTRLRAEQLRSETAHVQPQFAGQTLEAVTVSIGVASYPEHGATAEDLLRAADDALYDAKRAGRNRVHLHE